jgi:hypothetical protein
MQKINNKKSDVIKPIAIDQNLINVHLPEDKILKALYQQL